MTKCRDEQSNNQLTLINISELKKNHPLKWARCIHVGVRVFGTFHNVEDDGTSGRPMATTSRASRRCPGVVPQRQFPIDGTSAMPNGAVVTV